MSNTSRIGGTKPKRSIFCQVLRSTAFAVLLGTVALPALTITSPAQAGFWFGISVDFAPPPLPYYDQPYIPGPGYIWVPGYWAWDDDEEDYYWVPGTWVLPPEPGLYWTPPYWAWEDGFYVFHDGYWGPTVGFYGGINYGCGYTGYGYDGGHWNRGSFHYNRAVNNITNINVTNVYVRNVTINRITNVSYNGGPGGTVSRPTHMQLAMAREYHAAPTYLQQSQERSARRIPSLHTFENHGLPAIAATMRPGEMRGPQIIRPKSVEPTNWWRAVQDRHNTNQGPSTGNPGRSNEMWRSRDATTGFPPNNVGTRDWNRPPQSSSRGPYANSLDIRNTNSRSLQFGDRGPYAHNPDSRGVNDHTPPFNNRGPYPNNPDIRSSNTTPPQFGNHVRPFANDSNTRGWNGRPPQSYDHEPYPPSQDVRSLGDHPPPFSNRNYATPDNRPRNGRPPQFANRGTSNPDRRGWNDHPPQFSNRGQVFDNSRVWDHLRPMEERPVFHGTPSYNAPPPASKRPDGNAQRRPDWKRKNDERPR